MSKVLSFADALDTWMKEHLASTDSVTIAWPKFEQDVKDALRSMQKGLSPSLKWMRKDRLGRDAFESEFANIEAKQDLWGLSIERQADSVKITRVGKRSKVVDDPKFPATRSDVT